MRSISSVRTLSSMGTTAFSFSITRSRSCSCTALTSLVSVNYCWAGGYRGSSTGCNRVESKDARLRRDSLLRYACSAIVTAAHSGDNIHTGIFSRFPPGSTTATAPSSFGAANDLENNVAERMERIEDPHARIFRAQGIVGADRTHPHVHCVIPAGGLSPDPQPWVHPKVSRSSCL